MPELPEVEIVRRGLEPAVAGRTIRDVRFTPEGHRLLSGAPPAAFRDALVGRRILAAHRRGKYLILPLDDGRSLIAHLRMTGRIVVEPKDAPEGSFFRAAIVLDDGNELRWRDVRRFGTWQLLEDLSALEVKLGPEPLADGFTPAALAAALAGRAAPVKAVLLDQRRLAGLGNIYADEALFMAGIHPARPAASLTAHEIERLHRAVRGVLEKGLSNFGTTLRDFVNAYGQEGRNREHLLVYQRTGEPCGRCGTPVERTVIGGRGSHFCPVCQPAPGQHLLTHRAVPRGSHFCPVCQPAPASEDA
ncbi:MAG TPA: bifunctional DNA-formamidopyrimidine glycosylase/DNA-(apurinic or apyrimidinic site) lyase [Dehalococcoidia bacterium]|nr:bifunctional DNA-formamidopyrimidine glycosylase/DNA-(apurinic or apyrimidinic site) lyase [Dehalococcoidia bacterium]